MDAGLLLARMVLGLLMAAHGSQKLFGWFGGYGLAGTGGFFESLGFRPGRLFAAAAAVTEVAGGLLLALGLLGPLGPAMIISVMIVAMATVHWPHGAVRAEQRHRVAAALQRVRGRDCARRQRRLLARRGAGPVVAGRGGLDCARPRGDWRIRESRGSQRPHRPQAHV